MARNKSVTVATEAQVAAIVAEEATPLTTEAPAAEAPARKNHHSIGKAWTGSTTITRMAGQELAEYFAYLSGLKTPNARQKRHLDRAAKYLALAGVDAEAEEGADA